MKKTGTVTVTGTPEQLREMGLIDAGGNFKGRATIAAVVHRLDGTDEDLGVIADSGPTGFIRRPLWQLGQKIAGGVDVLRQRLT